MTRIKMVSEPPEELTGGNEAAAQTGAETPREAGEDRIPTRRCSKCGAILPLSPSNWHRDRKCRDGLSTICKLCRIEYERMRRVARKTEAARDRSLLPPGEQTASAAERPVDGAAAAAGGCVPAVDEPLDTMPPEPEGCGGYMATWTDEIDAVGAVVTMNFQGHPQVIQALRAKASREIRTPVQQALWELRQALCGGGAA
jgi:hypothetical protein